jgi:hypothetical protein
MDLRSEQPRSRAFFQTLVDLCVDSYATHVINTIENEVLSDDSDCWNRAMQLSKSVSEQPTLLSLFRFFLPSSMALLKPYHNAFIFAVETIFGFDKHLFSS